MTIFKEHDDMEEIKRIKGIRYIPSYISEDEQLELISIIDNQIWSAELKRRVQHYGYKYDYKRRSISEDLYLGNLPNWLNSLIIRFNKEVLTNLMFDQVIINEYLPGQGISNHVDCVPCFENCIVSLSLCSSCVMNFVHIQSMEKTPILLEAGGLLVMQDEARYKWKHGIAPRMTDQYKGKQYERSRRVSLTFRKVVSCRSQIED